MCFNVIGAKIHNGARAGKVPTEADLKKAKKYSRVVIFGVDGAGDYFRCCDVPNFKRLYENGATSFVSLSQFPTISAQNWCSVLHGLKFQTHRVTNESAASQNFTRTQYPSVFKVCADRHPDWKFASFVNWYPINKGIVENMSNLRKLNGREMYTGDDSNDDIIDGIVCDETVAYVRDKAHDPKILYLHFDGPDEAGHAYGYGTPEYKKAVEKSDEYIGKIYDAYVNNGWGDDTLFITVSDHGHKLTRGHGGWNIHERQVTIAVSGGLGNVKKGSFGVASTLDVASIVLYALGEKQPDVYESVVPDGVFSDL